MSQTPEHPGGPNDPWGANPDPGGYSPHGYGPPGPPGGPQDREVVAFDGRVLVLRWTNPEVHARYGTGVYVRCGPEGVARRGQSRQ